MAVQAQYLRRGRLPARAVMRINSYIAIGLGVITLLASGPLAHSFGTRSPLLPALAGAALVLGGLEALGFAVGRRFRRVHVLPFAFVDAIAAAGCLALAAAGPGAITIAGRVFAALGACTFASFSYTEFRSAGGL